MTNLKPVDVAIIGGGWSGLSLAKELTARTSLSVAVIERGIPRKTSDYGLGMDELDYAIRMRMMQNIAEETITHRHSTRNTAVPVRQYGSFLPGSGVGGAGEHWNGVSFRFQPDLFTLRTHLTEKHGASKLSEDLAVQDWGVTYDDLEPHYYYGELIMGVSGKAGNLKGKITGGGNPFEGPRQNEYPNPPLKTSYGTYLFGEATKRMGLHPYIAPAANLSQAYTNPDGISRPACAYCGYCERFGCMIGAKSAPSNTLMPVLAKRKNFELRTGSWVRRILHKDGKATGIEYVDANGEEFFQPANVVALCSFTLNNTRLLMLSKIGMQYDPQSRKGTLGKNLTHQIEGNSRIYLDQPLNLFMGSGVLGMRIPDYDGAREPENEGLLRFGQLNCQTSGTRPIANFGQYPVDTVKTNWGSAWKKASLEWWDKSLAISLAGEHLSYRQNYMDLDPIYTDKFGDPLLRFTLDFTEHEHKQRDFAGKLATQIAREMGAKMDPYKPTRPKYNVINYQSTHIQGGAVMGTSPETSVVNRYLQHWDVPNLWVIGASAMPQNASHNPTLTVLALTYWASNAMIDRYLKNPGKLI